jgi:hypothetical protein
LCAGELQSFAWLALATGGLLGNLTGGFALQNITSQSMFSIFMILVGAQLLLCLSVSEVSFNLGLPEDTEPAVRQKDIGNVPREKNTCKQTFLQRGYVSEDLSSLKQHFWEPAVADMVPQQVWNELYLKPLKSAKTAMEGDGWKGPVSSMHQQVMLLKGLLQKPEILQPLLWFLSSSAIIPGLGSSISDWACKSSWSTRSTGWQYLLQQVPQEGPPTEVVWISPNTLGALHAFRHLTCESDQCGVRYSR